MTDQQLLRDYAANRTDAAFAELVRRHVDLVYSVALRLVRDAHLAEDVAQSVFVALAQKAATLTERPVLAGWLHRTTQNLAANVVRAEVRRRAREQEAVAMNELLEPDVIWENIAPQLDAALGELGEADRDALLLRYFQRQSARDMAQTLGVSEGAAQKRVNRAVDRLRENIAQRGLTVGAGGLGVVLTVNAVHAAPIGLALTISTTAMLAGAAVQTSTLIAATKTIVMTTFQKILITATVVALAGAGIYASHRALQLRDKNQILQQQLTPLAGQIQQLERERDAATNQLAGLQDEISKFKNNHRELLKLRGESVRLHQDSQELAQIKASQSSAKKDSVNIPGSFANLALSEVKTDLTNATSSSLAGLKTKLGLTPDQARQIHDILLGDIESRAQVQLSILTEGLSTTDAHIQDKKIQADEESQITALLNSDQQTAYQEMKNEQEAAASMNYAKSETVSMNRYLQLSPEESQAVTSILASLPAGQGGIGNVQDTDAKAQLEIRLLALAQTLTPEQLQTYRQKKLQQIDQAAMGIQMMKAAAK